MKSTKIKTKTEKGITLIALIITIVVLLILAVVAINSIQNDGILSHAGNVANTYNQSVQNEAEQLQNYLDYLDKANGGSEGDSTEGTTYTAYTIGDEVTIGSESFYVIADSDETQKMVTLLAKECIIVDKNDANYLTQSSTAGTVAFAETNYWSTKEGITYPYDFTEEVKEGQPDESHYALYFAYQYGKKIGGENTLGRLMTESEANDLDTDTRNALSAGTGYWLGTATSIAPVYFMVRSMLSLGGEDFTVSVSHCTMSSLSVRPVVEISKDLITLVTE